jgi:hypothetical protein
MTFTLTIDGVAKALKAGSLRISQTANGRATASFTILSEDRSYRPAIRDRVVMTEDGTTIFSGPIERVSERGMFKGSHPGIQLVISAADNNVYAERRYITEDIPAGTLKAALQVLEPYFTPYGIALHASQVNGPNLPALNFELVRADEVFNQLATLTADAGEPYVWDFAADDTFRMFQPSTVAAPFDLVGNNLPEVIGDIEVDTTLNPGYANKIIIKLAPKTEIAHTETFTGDGTTSVWSLTYTLIKDYGYVTDDTGTSPVTNKTLTTTPYQGTADWTYHPATNTLERDLGPLPLGQVAEFKFDGTFSGTYEATDPEWVYDPWERVLVLDTIPDNTTGQAFADAELAIRLTEQKTARYSTWEQGIAAGQGQTINTSARATNAAGMISEVEIRDLVHRLDRRVTTTTDSATTNLRRGWRDVYKAWLGDKSGTGGTTTAAGSATQGPSLPDESVQYNASGAFGGKATFIFKAGGNSVVIGDGSAITASSYESCFIAGKNCEISD